MRIIIGILILAVVLVAGVTIFNWVSGNNGLKIEAPTNGATLYSDNVRVRLSASDKTKGELAASGNSYSIVTYLDGKEIQRGKDLTFDLNNLPVGQHQLKVAVSDNRSNLLGNISLQPGQVDFKVAAESIKGSSGTANYINSAVRDGSYNLPATGGVPGTNSETSNAAKNTSSKLNNGQNATSAGAPATKVNLPASGAGWNENLSTSSKNSIPANFSNPAVNAAQNGSTFDESPFQAALRSLIGFYVASFIVSFSFVLFTIVKRRKSKRA